MRVESNLVEVVAATAFTYDDRGRLLSEWRTRQGGTVTDYHYVYAYDQVGNRALKTTTDGQEQVRTTEYHYDVESPGTYRSNNNRLMYAETYDELQTPRELVSTTWYYYVTRRKGGVDRPLCFQLEVGGLREKHEEGRPLPDDRGHRGCFGQPRQQLGVRLPAAGHPVQAHAGLLPEKGRPCPMAIASL
ncbi:MAG TPA: hypothetical protein PKK06_17450 [Phycisphaerae bacterium]|nr:hypothetical protein [Phycisphaerae bacterium]HNU46993.1 hypothetical protein [Phycisphaerae bacterium]